MDILMACSTVNPAFRDQLRRLAVLCDRQAHGGQSESEDVKQYIGGEIAILRTIEKNIRQLVDDREALMNNIVDLDRQRQQCEAVIDALARQIDNATKENVLKCELGSATMEDFDPARQRLLEYRNVVKEEALLAQQLTSCINEYVDLGKAIEAEREQFNAIISSIYRTGDEVGEQSVGSYGNGVIVDIMTEIYATGDTETIAIAEIIQTCNAETRHAIMNLL
jgi:prefoldin subunit 5